MSKNMFLIDVSSVINTNKGGAKLIAKYLMGLGAQRNTEVIFITSPRFVTYPLFGKYLHFLNFDRRLSFVKSDFIPDQKDNVTLDLHQEGLGAVVLVTNDTLEKLFLATDLDKVDSRFLLPGFVKIFTTGSLVLKDKSVCNTYRIDEFNLTDLDDWKAVIKKVCSNYGILPSKEVDNMFIADKSITRHLVSKFYYNIDHNNLSKQQKFKIDRIVAQITTIESKMLCDYAPTGPILMLKHVLSTNYDVRRDWIQVLLSLAKSEYGVDYEAKTIPNESSLIYVNFIAAVMIASYCEDHIPRIAGNQELHDLIEKVVAAKAKILTV